MPVYPPQSYPKRTDWDGNKTQQYIGTWDPITARAIAKQLRKEGFRVQTHYRGPRFGTENTRLSDATHGAVYVQERPYDFKSHRIMESKLIGGCEVYQ